MPETDRCLSLSLGWNTWRNNRDFERVNRSIRELNADVLLLQELTEGAGVHLTGVGDICRVFTWPLHNVLTSLLRILLDHCP